MKDIRKKYWVYLFIFILQILNIIYWANVKTNFYIDELYSLGYASIFAGTGDTAQYITTSPEWQLNEWVDNSAFKKYLFVSNQEQIFRLSFPVAIHKLLAGSNYDGLLNIAESVAGCDNVSVWPSVMLNILFFAVAETALLTLMRKLKMETWSQYLALAMFGFSGYIISCVIYIRFYMLVIMYLLLILNLFFTVWRSNGLKCFVLAEMGIFALAYLSYKNSELTVPYFGAISLCFIIALLMAKKWKRLVSYTMICICGVAWFFFRTDYLHILFHATDYSVKNSNVAVKTSVRIAQASIWDIKSYVCWVAELFSDYYFGNYMIVLAAVIVLMAYSIWKCSYRKRDNLNKRSSFKISICTVGLNQETGFACVLLGAALLYTIFTALAGFSTWRYYCFGFVTLIIVFWYMLDRIIKKPVLGEAKTGWYIILTVFVIASILTPFKTRNVQYVYEEDEELKNCIEQYKDMDTILVCSVDAPDEFLLRHDVYDCVNQMSENSRIYAIDIAEYTYDSVDFPGMFVLWSHYRTDISGMMDDLTEYGYEIESLGTNHVSQVYVCRVNENANFLSTSGKIESKK